MATQSQRRFWYTPEEKNLLVSIIGKYNDAILNKKTDAASNHQKNKAWAAVTREFNALWVSSLTKRSAKQLKKCWEAMKFKKKRESAIKDGGTLEPGAIIIDSSTQFADLPITVVKVENESSSSYDGASTHFFSEAVDDACAPNVTIDVSEIKSEHVDLPEVIEPTAEEAPFAASPILLNSVYSVPNNLNSESSVTDTVQQLGVELPAEERGRGGNMVTEEEEEWDAQPAPSLRTKTARRIASREHYLRLAAKEKYEQQKEERQLVRQLYRAKLLALRRESRVRLSLLKAQRRHCCYRRQRTCDT